MSAYIPHQLTTSWDTFKIYIYIYIYIYDANFNTFKELGKFFVGSFKRLNVKDHLEA